MAGPYTYDGFQDTFVYNLECFKQGSKGIRQWLTN